MPEIGHNNPPQEGNWFAVSRDVFTHYLVGIHNRPYTEFEAWLSLLAMAKYEPQRATNKGKTIVLDPGQLMAAHGFLATRWSWHISKVRRFLNALMRELMITRFCNMQNGKRGDNQIQIITICNYSHFQRSNAINRQANRQANEQASDIQATSKRQAIDNNITRKQGNKETRKQDISPNGDLSFSPSAKPDPSPELNVQLAFEQWNEFALRLGLPQARTLTPNRRKSLAARLREHGGMIAWQRALNNIENSAFLQGRNDKGWRCNLDFLLQASSFAKLIDGTYGNGAFGKSKWSAYYGRDGK